MSTKAKQPKSPLKSSTQFAKLHYTLLARSDIGLAAKVVHAVLRDHGDQSGAVQIGTRRLAVLTGLGRATVVRAIRSLAGAGLLKVHPSGAGKRNQYGLVSHSLDRSQNESGSDRSQNESTSNKPASNRATSGLKMSPQPVSKSRHVQTRLDIQTTTAKPRAKSNNETSPHQTFIDHFSTRWATMVGGGARYEFGGAKDGTLAKRILSAVNGDLDRAKQIVELYLTDTDPWLRDKAPGRPLSVLASSARLPGYIAQTAKRLDAGKQTAPAEHWVIREARQRWSDDLAAHLQDYRAIADHLETGRLGSRWIKRAFDLESGAKFREQAMQEAQRNG